MRAYIRGEVEIWLPSGIYFHTDPVRQLQKISQQKVFVTAHGFPPMLLQRGNDLRDEMYKHAEEVRCKSIASHRT